ncbi:microfibril-associated glycoprotein 4 [Magallana gigas]|uniref:Fibrinogen C-terminal domain-containing protein n=1 Tax=Magallana gigas TaxID=29159 RepID=A0A8W8JPS9_MAGGI|nr:microfibril-associated glycoprotein 4-like isoform X2 [Crassostrea gigas]XP_034336790.1 microfibril-associated glycoprotein 4-like isoform X2 [Crassostrea gigas]XP_034336791.1 microfibril-associated glycoprotein 4-like isoform X2 [Crassostrea gigas]
MEGMLSILIFTLLLKSTNGQLLYDDVEEEQKCVNVAAHIIKNELQQFTKSIERIVKQNIEGIKNLDASVRNMKTDFQKLLVLQQEAIDNSTNIIGDKLTCSDRLTPILGTDCADILKRYPDTRGKDGVYDIVGLNRIMAVYCDMTTDNGGWTVIQRRVNGSVNFNNNWTEYKNGFGFADHEYWIGNDMLHRLTSQKPQELRVDMERFNGEKAYAVYSRFAVGDETSKYKLEVNGYSGNAGDSLDYHNNMKFSTPDQDNDNKNGSCATKFRSGLWFNNCYFANPNGQYTDSEITGPGYIIWKLWKNSSISLKSIQLMIRPRF